MSWITGNTDVIADVELCMKNGSLVLQELSVFIRDVLELKRCPFLTRIKGLTGNLIASTTLIPPDQWIIKVRLTSNNFIIRMYIDNENTILDKILKNLTSTIRFMKHDCKLLQVPPGTFTTFTCPPSSPQSSIDRMELTAAPTSIGRMPHQFFDERVLR